MLVEIGSPPGPLQWSCRTLCAAAHSSVLSPEAWAVTPLPPLWYTPGVGIQGLPLWKDWSSEQEGVHTQDGHHTTEGPHEPGDSVTERGLLPPACVSPQIQFLHLHLLHEHLHLSPVPPLKRDCYLLEPSCLSLAKTPLLLLSLVFFLSLRVRD